MALGIGTALVTVLYLLLNLVFIYAAPLEEMKGEVAVGAFAASRLFGPEIAGIFSRADGALADVDGERDGDHRPARVLRHGGERSVSGDRRQGGSALAHSRGGDCRAGHLRDADDADAVPATGSTSASR